ncbi:conserved hypothetical protein [Culex quinquefasciatus]|uniref:DUF7083 domain-containing protein n=1 Tax=Culex quinquefasciatus TaxID=7176 RepID=B0WKC1_CULQU|nr:conserved hypothetical protein [Culex quinquefasciatus]|eukprot:XP_001849155.1 conserved hypothetical protein [Culex quinquefasciatus]
MVERDVVDQQEVSVSAASAALRACRRVRHLQAAQRGLCRIHLPMDLRFQAGLEVRDCLEQGCRSRWKLQVLPGRLAATVELLRSGSQDLDDPARVRLLLRKLSTPVHEKYTNTVLSNHPRDFTLAQTVAKLKKLFGRQKSVFHARYQCLQYAKNDADDFTTYAATVNKHCEAFQLSKLSSDQFKALRFVCGLQSSRDADIRARLISKLEADETAAVEAAAAGAAAGDAGAAGVAARSRVTLENLVEECHRVANLKQDTLMVENKDARNVYIVSRNQKKPASQGKPKTPKTPCWKCGDNHYVRAHPWNFRFKNEDMHGAASSGGELQLFDKFL